MNPHSQALGPMLPLALGSVVKVTLKSDTKGGETVVAMVNHGHYPGVLLVTYMTDDGGETMVDHGHQSVDHE